MSRAAAATAPAAAAAAAAAATAAAQRSRSRSSSRTYPARERGRHPRLHHPGPARSPAAIAPVSAPVRKPRVQLPPPTAGYPPPGSALVSAPAGNTKELLPTAPRALSADYHPHAGHHAAPPASASKVTVGTLVR